MVVTSSTVVVYVSVTGLPVRNAVASATAFSVEPAIVVNGAANLFATRTWPGDVSVTGLPVRNAVASATAFSVEPAIVVNGAANLFATRTWPGDVSVVVEVE